MITIPKGASRKYVRGDKSIAYATYDAPTSDHVPSDFLIEIYPPDSFQPSCSPLLTGASMSVPLETANGQASWGRVDYYDNGANMYNPNPDPLCRPPSLNSLTPDLVEKFAPTRAAYVLCSEKDGKAVIVCVSQMTRDESLAKQIFETFRWTK